MIEASTKREGRLLSDTTRPLAVSHDMSGPWHREVLIPTRCRRLSRYAAPSPKSSNVVLREPAHAGQAQRAHPRTRRGLRHPACGDSWHGFPEMGSPRLGESPHGDRHFAGKTPPLFGRIAPWGQSPHGDRHFAGKTPACPGGRLLAACGAWSRIATWGQTLCGEDSGLSGGGGCWQLARHGAEASWGERGGGERALHGDDDLRDAGG